MIPADASLFTAAPLTPARLQDSLATIRSLLPLPHEVLHLSQSDERDQLAAIIDTTSLGQPILRLARQLRSRDLRHIFPLLAEANQATETHRGHFHEKLCLIVRERACPSLYRIGWTVFQQSFPCQPVARALAILCAILEIKGQSRSTGVADQERCLPLISRLVQPDARQFVDRLVRALDRMKLSLDPFMSSFAVSPDWPLGAALIGHIFLEAGPAIFAGGHNQFRQALAQADPDLQRALLRRLFSLDDLSPDVANRYCQIVYSQFGIPAAGHPVWRQTRPRDRERFTRWVIAATIGSHCRKTPEKARFYLQYAQYIRDTERWDETTLILHFPGFVIADDNRQMLLALYYNQPNPEELPFALAVATSNINPASPAMPHRRVDDAIRRASKQGVVGLLLDEDGRSSSAAFLNFCLQDKKSSNKRRPSRPK
jgi:hypothetical protein